MTTSAALLLLAALMAPHASQLASATVVRDFSEVARCKDSLYMGTPPRGIADGSLKKICQSYANQPRYVTLYHPKYRIPVYSAYTFKKTEGDRRVDYPWMYEPQLAETDGNGNMQPFPMNNLHMKFEDSQAVLEDYSNVVLYERGHLNPDQHQSDPFDRAATYTLTNVVPQIRQFNIGPWREHEERIRLRLNNYCRGTAYVITGVTINGNMIRRHNQMRVGIPENMWSAYCCTDYDHNSPPHERMRFPSQAALAKNSMEGNQVLELTVQELESQLNTMREIYHDVQIFYDNCNSPSPLPANLVKSI